MWDLPRLGLEPMSPVLAGRFLITVPPGKSKLHYFLFNRCFWAPIMCPNCATHCRRMQRNRKQSLPLKSFPHSGRRDTREIPWKQLKTSLWKIRLNTHHALSKRWQKSMDMLKKFKMVQKSTVKSNSLSYPLPNWFSKGNLCFEFLVQPSSDSINMFKHV